jgi:sulfite exporter TauE/SafE
MTALFAGVVVASLAGSLHCLAMCGPLAGVHGARLAAVHSLGRLVTYVILGALAGGLGHALDLAGELAAIQRIAIVVAGVVLVAWATVQLGVALGWWRTRASGGTAFRAGLVAIRRRRPAARAWLAGALVGLLPCGWLWAFVVAAAGTGSPLTGAAVMVAFWIGSLPAMIGALTVLAPALGWLRARMPIVTALALLALGLGTLALRWMDAGEAQVAAPHCHRCGS